MIDLLVLIGEVQMIDIKLMDYWFVVHVLKRREVCLWRVGKVVHILI